MDAGSLSRCAAPRNGFHFKKDIDPGSLTNPLRWPDRCRTSIQAIISARTNGAAVLFFNCVRHRDFSKPDESKTSLALQNGVRTMWRMSRENLWGMVYVALGFAN
jgi:hypothetical protein